jgi:hypothetical protein
MLNALKRGPPIGGAQVSRAKWERVSALGNNLLDKAHYIF